MSPTDDAAPSADERFARLLADAGSDPAVVGLVLGGSRGKGAYVTDRSDYDVYLVFADDAAPGHDSARYTAPRGEPVETALFTLAAFREHAMPGTPTRRNAYTFAHVAPALDKLGGELAEIVRAKAVAAPGDDAEHLDSYVNAHYRAVKNARDGRGLEAHLDAAEAVPWFLEFVFAVHGRVRPYNKWLRWELEHHPLEPAWTAALPERLSRLIAAGDRGGQHALFRDAEALARDRGLGHVIDEWEPDVRLLRGEED